MPKAKDATSDVYEEYSLLATEFAEAEAAAIRVREFRLRSFYAKRQALIDRIPDFWSTVFRDTGAEVDVYLTQADKPILAFLRSLRIERHLIVSETEGDPRGLRFTFEFDKNEYFENTTLVKEFHPVASDLLDDRTTSKPVPIKWKGKKKDPTKGVLDLAIELFNAEETLRAEKVELEIDHVERESLWAYEKLQTKLEGPGDSEKDLSFFNWFGYRGAVAPRPCSHDSSSSEDAGGRDIDEDDDGLLDVEICGDGDGIATTLAEDFWQDVMDNFIHATQRSEHLTDGEDPLSDETPSETEVPDLVLAAGGSEAASGTRPKKRRRRN